MENENAINSDLSTDDKKSLRTSQKAVLDVASKYLKEGDADASVFMYSKLLSSANIERTVKSKIETNIKHILDNTQGSYKEGSYEASPTKGSYAKPTGGVAPYSGKGFYKSGSDGSEPSQIEMPLNPELINKALLDAVNKLNRGLDIEHPKDDIDKLKTKLVLAKDTKGGKQEKKEDSYEEMGATEAGGKSLINSLHELDDSLQESTKLLEKNKSTEDAKYKHYEDINSSLLNYIQKLETIIKAAEEEILEQTKEEKESDDKYTIKDEPQEDKELIDNDEKIATDKLDEVAQQIETEKQPTEKQDVLEEDKQLKLQKDKELLDKQDELQKKEDTKLKAAKRTDKLQKDNKLIDEMAKEDKIDTGKLDAKEQKPKIDKEEISAKKETGLSRLDHIKNKVKTDTYPMISALEKELLSFDEEYNAEDDMFDLKKEIEEAKNKLKKTGDTTKKSPYQAPIYNDTAKDDGFNIFKADEELVKTPSLEKEATNKDKKHDFNFHRDIDPNFIPMPHNTDEAYTKDGFFDNIDGEPIVVNKESHTKEKELYKEAPKDEKETQKQMATNIEPQKKSVKSIKKDIKLTFDFTDMFNTRYYRKYKGMLNEAAFLVARHKLDEALEYYYVIKDQHIPKSFKMMLQENIDNIENTITETFYYSDTIVKVNDTGDVSKIKIIPDDFGERKEEIENEEVEVPTIAFQED